MRSPVPRPHPGWKARPGQLNRREGISVHPGAKHTRPSTAPTAPHTHCGLLTWKVSRAPARAQSWLSTALRAAPQDKLYHWDPIILLATPLSPSSCLQTRGQENSALFQESPSTEHFAAYGGAVRGLRKISGLPEWKITQKGMQKC